MRCPNCQSEINDRSRFCRICGAPVPPSPPVMKAPIPESPSHDGETQLLGRSARSGETELLGRSARSGETQLLSGVPHGQGRPVPPPPAANPAKYPPNAGYSQNTEQLQNSGYHNYGNQPEQPKKKKNLRVAAISIISFLLVAAIAAGVFVILSGNVSDAELKEARGQFLPPAKAVSIDMTKNDPSNDAVKFTYDDRRRVSTCQYKVGNKEYSQKYIYDDNAGRIEIDTEYKKHPLLTQYVEYRNITLPDVFVSVDGYYLRMDEESLKKKDEPETEALTEAPAVTPTEAPAPTPTEAPVETPTEAPTEAPAEAPTSGYTGLKTELNGYIGTNIHRFAEDVIGLMTRSASTDGSIGYENDAVRVSTRPQQESISSISVIAPCDYCICGITPGMTLSDASAANAGVVFQSSENNPDYMTFYYNGCDVAFQLDNGVITYVSIDLK